MPSLRRSIPDPHTCDYWPEATQTTTTDVFVSGVSLLRLVEVCQTPCVHTGAAVIPGTHGRPSPYADAAVVVVRVTAVLNNLNSARVVLIDACLGSVNAVSRETRLIGRASTVKKGTAIVLSGESHETPCTGRAVLDLPDDLHEGDLLAMPCAGAVALRQVRAKVPLPHQAEGPASFDAAEIAWLRQLA